MFRYCPFTTHCSWRAWRRRWVCFPAVGSCSAWAWVGCRRSLQPSGYFQGPRRASSHQHLQVVRRLWTERTVAHDGQYYPFEESVSSPKSPVPIWVGGEARRRGGGRAFGDAGSPSRPHYPEAPAGFTRKSACSGEALPDRMLSVRGTRTRGDHGRRYRRRRRSASGIEQVK